MLLIESFVHRTALSEILTRWMIGRPAPGDVKRLKTIINLNSYISRLWLDWFSRDTLGALHGRYPVRYVVRTKGQLKDFVVEHPRYTSPRIEEMLEKYRRFPEDYYRDTPIDGAIYVNHVGDALQFVGSSRIKRFRRIAEKGSRRIVDFMLARIRANADMLAEERARSLGIAKDQLITSREMMVEEFNHAERRVLKSIRQGTIQAELPELGIPDVAGAKVIVEAGEYDRFLGILRASSSVRIIEEERHTGNYKGVNLRLAYAFPKEKLLAAPPNEEYMRVLTYRGFDAGSVPRIFREFIEGAEDEVRLEMIVVDFQEFLESEIGRCMHEERVQTQRAHHEYNGHLATNVRYLMEFLLSLCRAPGCDDLAEVPIKLWVKYMPDTIDRALRGLYISQEYFFDTAGTPSLAPPRSAIEAPALDEAGDATVTT
jgi:hypothetical protein